MKYFDLKRRKKALEKLLKDIPGEPCATSLNFCKHPADHERYYHANTELIDVTEQLSNLPLTRFWRFWNKQIIAAALGGLLGFAVGHRQHYSRQTLELYDALQTNKFTIEPFVFYVKAEHLNITGDVEKWETVTGQLRILIRERTNKWTDATSSSNSLQGSSQQ